MTIYFGVTRHLTREYVLALVAVPVWMLIASVVPVLDRMPGVALLAAFIAVALTLHHRPALAAIGVGTVILELIRPAPSLLAHIQAGAVVAIIGAAVVMLAYGRTAQLHGLLQYEILFEEQPLPMLLIDDASLGILKANSAATDLYGYTRAELEALSIPQLLAHVDPAAPGRPAWASEGRSGTEQHRARDGRLIDVLIRSRPVALDRRRGRLVLIEDTSERRTLEAQLRQAQKMEAVGQLAGGIAHDFNNLLTAVRGYAALLMEALPDDDPRRLDAVEIDRAGARGSALTSQLLAFSRKQLLQFRVVSINRTVEELAPMLARLLGEHIVCQTVLRARSNVRLDPAQLQQVLMNLVVNARDALPNGGQITIETSDVVLDENYVRTHAATQAGPHSVLTVSDNGIGMDADTQRRVFEPFFTTKRPGQGTGLGLSTVYGIVKQSSGCVWLYSEPGKGTTFKIYFPSTGEREDVQPVTATVLKTGVRTGTILVVEDEDGVRALIVRILTHAGYRVLAAANVAEGRKVFADRLGPIDLLLTDLVLPDGSGREVAEAASPSQPGVRVLYMSGYTDDTVVRHGILNAEADFIQKPFPAAGLVERVEGALARPL